MTLAVNKSRMVSLALSAGMLLLPAVSSAVSQAEYDDLQGRVRALEARVSQLENGSAAAAPSVTHAPQTNPWRQLKQGMTEQEVSSLLGATSPRVE